MFQNKVSTAGEGKALGIQLPRTGFGQALECLAGSPDPPRCALLQAPAGKGCCTSSELCRASPVRRELIKYSSLGWQKEEKRILILIFPPWCGVTLSVLRIPKPADPGDEGKWGWLVLHNVGGHFRAVGVSVAGDMATVGLDYRNTT